MLLSQFEVARDWIGERRPRPSYWLMMARQENEKTRCLGSIKKIANKYRNVDMFYIHLSEWSILYFMQTYTNTNWYSNNLLFTHTLIS